MSLDKILITSGDTDFTPFDTGAYASSTTIISGGAVKKAAEQVRAQVLELAAKMLATPVEKLACGQNEVFTTSEPRRGVSIAEVTEIRSLSPSLCSVPGACSIHLDRRLTAGDTKESALAEVRALPGAEAAEIEILSYDRPSYTGLRYPMEKYYPTWVLEESHPVTQAAIETYRALWNREPVIDKWTFSTNGVGSMGLMKVPTIGFGPGEEEVAHSVAERVPIEHLVKAAEFYAAFPLTYASRRKGQGNG